VAARGMNLRALQRGVRNHILRGAPHVESAIRGEAAPRLAVYHNAYRMQLLDCLRDTYAKTRAWLGDEQFDAAGLSHIEANTPDSWTLNVYGRGFAHTLAQRYPRDAEVAELAVLEWMLRRAFDGPDSASVSADDLCEIDWEQALIRFVPTLRMTSVVSNCAAIWTAISESRTPPPAHRLEQAAVLRVWRQDLSPRFRSIGPDELCAIIIAMDGGNFGAICSSLATEERPETDVAAAAGALLASWLQDGLITAID